MKTNCGSSPDSITKTTSDSELVVDGIVKPEIAKIVRDILQEGANIAMYGNPFESGEGVIKEQERLYDKAIKDYTTLIQKQFMAKTLSLNV